MEEVAGLIVTYNRKEKLLKSINAMLQQNYPLKRIYIIDNNSTDNTYEYIKDVLDSNEKIIYIKLDENTGGSGGFSFGIKRIAEDGECKYIWGMDDDAYPKEDALLKIINELKENCCFYSNSNNDTEGFNENVKQVKNWMFVGFFIPITIVQKIGTSKSDYFIYHDDSEYAYRIIKAGYKIFKVKDSIIIHDNEVTNNNMLSKKVFKKNITIPKIPNWKMYYFIRNNILMYKFSDINRYKTALYIIPKFLMRVLIVNKKQFPIALKAYFHGIINISGKKVAP